MSIETFHSAYPADATFATYMARRPEYGTVSPVRFLADIYMREGGMGLAEISPEAVTTQQIDLETAQSFFVNSSAIFLGITTRAIEGIIVDHEFDQVTFNSLLENTFGGSLWTPTLFRVPDVETVPNDDVNRIIKVAQRDKTFAEFFKDGLYSLPRSLQAYLDRVGLVKYINILLLPSYIERARLLIQQNGHRATDAA